MNELPTTFGKYYLTEKLATGGMAEIYLAKLIGPGGFEKQLVIKQILPKLSGQRQFVDMFVAEAKTLVTLAHGNIVPVYELGVVDETYFIAMDYIDGPTLYRLTETMARREARMEPELAAWIIARMLEGLDYAHRKGEGVIHRDLSPRNVMLARDGEVKLVDFGIAVTLGDPGDGGASQSAPTGSFPYMSPEQVRREALTVQTDLFTTGVLMWEMLTGQRLFHRPDADATLQAVLDEEICRPSQVRAEVPARLDDVVMRALERDRTVRWSSAADMLAAINKFLYSLDEPPGPRDVAALVARFCPPETRRLPTHLEAMAQDVITPDPLAPEPEPPRGPATAVIPREARVKAQRQQSFATNVDLAPIFEATGQLTAISERGADGATRQERASTPRTDTVTERDDAHDLAETTEHVAMREPVRPSRRLAAVEMPLDHASDIEAPTAVPAAAASTRAREPQNTASRARSPDRAAGSQRVILVEDLPGDPRRQRGLPGQRAPSRATLIVIGLGGVALTVAAIYVFLQGRDRVLHAGEDAAVVVADASARERDATAATATPDALTTAAVVDAGAAHVDAGVVRVDSGRTRRADAGVTAATIRPDAAVSIDAGVRGTATLQIGADPWGEIYIDTKPMGRTPRELVVPAGRHTVEIVFPAETPPRRHTFVVDLATGETRPLQADFRD